MSINNQDLQVAEYLKSIEVESSFINCGETFKDGWHCDSWLICFNDQRFEFNTGIGHRVQKPTNQLYLKREDKNLIKEIKDLYNITDRSIKAHFETREGDLSIAPTQASVLYCLLLDSCAADESFNNWCDNFGYDSDSIKAFKIYQDCCKNAAKLGAVFNRDQLSKLSELLEEY